MTLRSSHTVKTSLAPSKPPSLAAITQALDILMKSFWQENGSEPPIEIPTGAVENDDLAMRRRHLDQKVKVIQTCLRSIDSEGAQQIAALHHHRNTTVSFHKLPAELHSTILSYDVHYHGSPVQRLLDLSTVARNWWNLIKSDPFLWTTIRTDQKGLSMALKRSRNCPLDVIVELPLFEIASPNEEIVDSRRKGLSRAVRTLAPHTQRWQSACIRSWSFSALIPILENPLPVTEKLDAGYTGGRFRYQPVKLVGGPRLHTVTLSGLDFSFSQAQMAGLKKLSILNIQMKSSSWTAELLDALTRCPLLVNLHLSGINSYVGPMGVSQAIPNVSLLPNLKVLEASRMDPMALGHLGECLRVPGLAGCTLKGLRDYDLAHILFPSGDGETISRAFQDAIREEGALVVLNGSSLTVRTRSGRFEIEHDPGEAPRIEPVLNVADFLTNTTPNSRTWLRFGLNSALRAHTSVLDRFPRVSSVSVGSQRDTLHVLKYVSSRNSGHCSSLQKLRLNWSREEAASMDSQGRAAFLKHLEALKIRRPEIAVCDWEGTYYEENMEGFMVAEGPQA